MNFTGIALQALRDGKLKKLCKRGGGALAPFHGFFGAAFFAFYRYG
jgi:hypothetical protein